MLPKRKANPSPHTQKSKVLVRMCRDWTPVHCWWECKVVQSLWETVWRLLKKVRYRIAIWPSNIDPLWSSRYPKSESKGSKRSLYTHVYSSIVHASQEVEATHMSMDWWLDKKNVKNSHLLFHYNTPSSFLLFSPPKPVPSPIHLKYERESVNLFRYCMCICAFTHKKSKIRCYLNKKNV